MKILPYLLTASTVALLGLITGCESTPTTPQSLRTAELSADYQKLSAESKEDVGKGLISRGQDPKTVYMALGKPDLITTSADGHVVTWIYDNYLPPQTKEQKQATYKDIKQRNNLSEPLQDIFESWNANVERHSMETNAEIAPRAQGQSWADYGKYRREREFARGGAVYLDRQAREEYKASLYIDPAPDAVSIKLEVIFIEELVSDAIVNDSVSAFATNPEEK
jgi:hypothetical protein|uniref:hypothetical protein n=1 Tax=Cephaloticoccus sp. TaxID=1985742 RepID=UPI004048EAFD